MIGLLLIGPVGGDRGLPREVTSGKNDLGPAVPLLVCSLHRDEGARTVPQLPHSSVQDLGKGAVLSAACVEQATLHHGRSVSHIRKGSSPLPLLPTEPPHAGSLTCSLLGPGHLFLISNASDEWIEITS